MTTQAPVRARSTRIAHAIMAILATTALLVTGNLTTASAPAYADDYPSWADVLQARNDEARAKAEVARIQRIINDLQVQVEETQRIAEEKADIWFQAQAAYDAADLKAQELQRQADEANERAAESHRQAGQLAASLARTGGRDLTTTLFLNGDNATDLLSTLGMSAKLAQQSQSLYNKALQDQNTAQSLTDQANVAAAALEELALIAEAAMQEAQAAADAAAAALQAQQDNIARLQAQLATLQSERIHTEAEYIKGVQERWGPGAGGEVSDQGWARPSGGNISSNFGPRACNGCSTFHLGVDLAPGCNAPIYAAAPGTVVYAGWFSGYGNHIKIDHGNGLTTSYSHIVNGGIGVSYGQHVAPGQNIARVGNTGQSFGCHLHFEVRINNSATDPVPFLRAKGVSI
ncbi:MAG TPA: peptidoglycan DD-metalloendopeptidase family protein [Terrimesophilobacter sp.]|nr:peptidoglycan DD-metalloendopeptidase family protein [Terrimesophilobacter sp.]HRQ01020.1 peptidoglycan DD-metalloendopeptidase family protein [Terrimesophilobacter sp.]